MFSVALVTTGVSSASRHMQCTFNTQGAQAVQHYKHIKTVGRRLYSTVGSCLPAVS